MESLLFVYNAKSDFWSKKMDFAHKIISPNTYACSLCSLTHNNLGETELWKNFRTNSNIKMDFIYKDEFQKLYPNVKLDYPVIFKENPNANGLAILLNAKNLKKIKSVSGLISMIQSTI